MAWTMLDSCYVRIQIFVWVTEKKSKYRSAVIKHYNYFSFLSWKNSMQDLRKFRHRKTTWLQNVHTTKSHSKKQLVQIQTLLSSSAFHIVISTKRKREVPVSLHKEEMCKALRLYSFVLFSFAEIFILT